MSSTPNELFSRPSPICRTLQPGSVREPTSSRDGYEVLARTVAVSGPRKGGVSIMVVSKEDMAKITHEVVEAAVQTQTKAINNQVEDKIKSLTHDIDRLRSEKSKVDTDKEHLKDQLEEAIAWLDIAKERAKKEASFAKGASQRKRPNSRGHREMTPSDEEMISKPPIPRQEDWSESLDPASPTPSTPTKTRIRITCRKRWVILVYLHIYNKRNRIYDLSSN